MLLSRSHRLSFWFPSLSVLGIGLMIGILIALLTLWLKTDTIEKMLLQQSRYQLFKQQLPAVHIQVEGRDIHLMGTVTDARTLQKVVGSIEQLPGVRIVTQALTIAPQNLSPKSSNKAKIATHPLNKLDLSGLTFPHGSTHFPKHSIPVLKQLVESLSLYPDTLVEVAAHSTREGVIAGQMQLTQLRAQAVVDYLINQGIPAERLIARGYGASRAATTNVLQKNFIELNIFQE